MLIVDCYSLTAQRITTQSDCDVAVNHLVSFPDPPSTLEEGLGTRLLINHLDPNGSILDYLAYKWGFIKLEHSKACIIKMLMPTAAQTFRAQQAHGHTCDQERRMLCALVGREKAFRLTGRCFINTRICYHLIVIDNSLASTLVTTQFAFQNRNPGSYGVMAGMFKQMGALSDTTTGPQKVKKLFDILCCCVNIHSTMALRSCEHRAVQ